MISHFNKKGVNGELTIGENISDLGGFHLAYYAAPDSLDKCKIFHYYADLWKSKRSKKYKEILHYIDVHSPPIHRVNSVFSHFDEFYEKYDIQKDDNMFIPARKRCKLFSYR